MRAGIQAQEFGFYYFLGFFLYNMCTTINYTTFKDLLTSYPPLYKINSLHVPFLTIEMRINAMKLMSLFLKYINHTIMIIKLMLW